jgi:hypothetical protein
MALGFNIFAVYYGVRVRWESTELGPAVLTLFSFLALTLDYFFLAAWFGNFPGRYVIRAVLLTAAAGAVFWHLAWLVYVQRRNRYIVKTGGQDGEGQGPVSGAVTDDRGYEDRPERHVVDGAERADPRS